MKRIFLFGVLPLALSGAGCATVNHGNTVKTAVATPASKASGTAAASAPVTATDTLISPNVDVGVFLAQAQQARMSGDMTRAIKILSQLVLVAPDDSRVLGEYGKALAAYGRSDDAVAFLDRAIQLQPGDWTLYSAQGVAYDQQGKYQSAQLSYARAMELKPGEVTIINNDALSHMQAGDYAGAEHLLNQVSRGSPDYSRISKSLALLERLKPAPPATAAIAEPAHEIAGADSEPAPREAAIAPAPAAIPKQEAAVAQPMALTAQKEVAAAPSSVTVKQEAVRVTQAPAIVPVDLPVAKAKHTPAEPAPVAPFRSTLDRLKSDPTVVMAPIPADRPEAVAVNARPAGKTEPAAPKVDHSGSAAASGHPAPGFYVQAGSYLSDARARQAAAGLESLDVKIMQATVNGREVFRLRIGPFAGMTDAKKSYADARALGHSDLIIVKE